MLLKLIFILLPGIFHTFNFSFNEEKTKYFSGFIKSKKIETFFLNKKFDFLEPICSSCPNIECLATEGSFEITSNITICVRFDSKYDF